MHLCLCFSSLYAWQELLPSMKDVYGVELEDPKRENMKDYERYYLRMPCGDIPRSLWQTGSLTETRDERTERWMGNPTYIPENSENKPRGLYFSNALFKGLIFGGAYIRRSLSTEGNLRVKIDWASLIVGSKFTIFALFYFVFEANFPSTNPRGGLIFGVAI